jgi:hypothetical protein
MERVVLNLIIITLNLKPEKGLQNSLNHAATDDKLELCGRKRSWPDLD